MSYYEINVSKFDGKRYAHLFATAPRSITSEGQCLNMLALFKKKFPAEEGYKISAAYIATTSRNLGEFN